MAKKSPMALTMNLLKEKGLVYEKTEYWISYPQKKNNGKDDPKKPSGFRKDLLGFIDIMVLMGKFHIGIQVTSQTNQNARVKKITLDERIRPKAIKWLERGDRIEVWGWREIKQDKTDGTLGKVAVWKPKIVKITIADFFATIKT